MASNTDVTPGSSTLSRNYSLNSGSIRERDYEALKQQYDKANSELGTLRRRCEHAMKELDYYRQHHHSKLDASQVTSLDYDNLRKCYEDLDTSHAQTIIKLELAQDEAKRISKQYDDINQERNNSLRDLSSLKQQLAKAYSQMDRVIRDCNKFRDALQMTQQKYEEAVKQAMSFRQKANKEVQRLTDERNATMTEYNLIMSERDTVHKEMEKLSDDLSQAKRKNKLIESDNKDLLEEKQSLNYQLESLRREIASALHDRDKALKECNDLREKFGEYTIQEENNMLKSPLNSSNSQGENSTRKEIQVANISQRQRLDNLDQANQELESLRKSLDKTQLELTEALQEAEVSKGRRDWAFSERDKIVLERESIRTLCDKMRKERDRAVSELAESLRESDALKKHRNELIKEVKTLKETLEVHIEKENSLNHGLHDAPLNHSHDSAIDSDVAEWETEIMEMNLSTLSKDKSVGFELGGGMGDAQYPNNDIYVTEVVKGSVADGKLRVNDCLVRVNNMDCTNLNKRIVMDKIRSSIPIVHLVVRRRRRSNWFEHYSNNSSMAIFPNSPQPLDNQINLKPPAKVARWLLTSKLPAGLNHGITLESGVYISKIADDGFASKDSNLFVGDRVLRINNKSMDGCNALHDAMRILSNERNDSITLTTLKLSYLDAESTNVFIPIPRNKKESRPIQSYGQGRNYTVPSNSHTTTNLNTNRHSMDYPRAKSAQDKSSTWFREKFDLVRGRKHSKDRNRSTDQDKNGSSSCAPEQAIAELDSVIDSCGVGHTLLRMKRHNKDISAQEKNGGTWPKTRANINILDTIGTLGPKISRKKDRPPLSILATSNGQDEYFIDSVNNVPNALHVRNTDSAIHKNNMSNISTISNNSNASSHHNNMPRSHTPNRHSNVFVKEFNNDSYDKLPINRQSISLNGKSDDSLEYNPVRSSNSNNSKVSANEKQILKYLVANKQSKYNSDLERDSLGGHQELPLSLQPPRIHSPLLNPRVSFPFHPHPLPHLNTISTTSSLSRESISYDPPYNTPFVSHTHSHSVEVYQKRPLTSISSHQGQIDRDIRDSRECYLPDYTVSTFPRKEHSRFRIPSNPSVNSKNSTGKVSTGSNEPSSERGSPMPIFNVEILSPDSSSKRVPEYWSQKTLPGELRKVHIDKSNEPLGIQINCPESGGIFVSTVNENSLASRVGLQIGDQLLEVCGINIRNATYDLAASVLRQCGNSITMLVHSPDKFLEIGEGSGSGDNSCSSSTEPTPCNSPKEIRKSLTSDSVNQHTLQQIARDLQQRQTSSRSSKTKSISNEDEPRYLYIEMHKTSNLGISLVGGNAVGIFVHSVQRDSPAEHANLRTGDQILEYNGTDLRHATAEEAAYELAKPADKVTVFAHYRIDRYNEIKDKPGDSLYVRCGFDRSGSDLTDNHQLYFNKDDILYVDNTMFRGNPGHWLAWKLDSEGHRLHCGIIPSKYKVEEQLLLRRSSGDLESRGSTSARRSFFRRKKHQRSGSRDSKELASFCNVTSGWYSDNGTLHEDLSLCSYQRVERLECPEFRPVLVLGPLAECVIDKLVNDFPNKFRKCAVEIRQSQAQLEQDLGDIVDYKRKGNYFECITVSSIKQICHSQYHCMIDIPMSNVEKLMKRHEVYPIVLLIKFKSTKHIKEIKDRFSLDKLSGKAAKEMYEHCKNMEAEYRHLITAVIPAGVNITYMCTQVKAAIDGVHSKSQWIPVQ